MTTSKDIATFLNAEHRGPESVLDGFGGLESAGPGDLAFCTYDDPTSVRESGAGTVICAPTIPPVTGRTTIAVERPRLGFARAVDEFFVERPTETEVHPTAVVHPDAKLGEETVVGPNAVVGEQVTIGSRCVIRAGATIGCAGFGFAREESGRLHRLPHRGHVRIEDDVEIGANTTIDRAVFDETVVGRGAKLSGQVHLAHQVVIGPDTTVACGSVVAGSAEIGRRVTIHPHASVATDVRIGDDAEVGMNAGVLDDVEAGATVVGTPARTLSQTASIE